MPAKRSRKTAEAIPTASTAAAPLSAVAARKLALASNSPVSTPAPVVAAPEPSTSSVTIENAVERQQKSPELASEGSSSEAEDESVPRKQRPRSTKKADKPKRERYWATTSENTNGQTDTQATAEPSAAEEATMSVSAPSTPRIAPSKSRRQRRQVIDELCVSSIDLQESMNYYNIEVNLAQKPHRATLLLLKADETLVIHGTYDLVVLSGKLSVCGATLRASERPVDLRQSLAQEQLFTVFAPSSHPLPVLRPELGTDRPSDVTLPGGTEIDMRQYAAAILLLSVSTGIESVEQVLATVDIGSNSALWPARSASPISLSWDLLLQQQPSLVASRPVQSWDEGITRIARKREESERLIVLLEGPKRAGKSTFGRQLVNRLTSHGRVALLDTDLGQPELTPPGFVSLSIVDRPLLGPAFCHPSVPAHAHFIGDVSPADNPPRYLEAVADLVASYRYNYEQDGVPLVINTQGWVKGLGADLLQAIKGMLQPNMVVRLGSDSDQAPTATQTEGCDILVLETAPVTPLESRFTASDLRMLQIVSHSYARLTPAAPATSWDFSTALVRTVPFALDWRDRSKLSAVHIVGGDVKYEHALFALNGALVAVLGQRSSDERMQYDAAQDASLPYDPDVPLPPLSETRALGLAVIRSVDPEQCTLHILTSIPQALLVAGPVTLVKGALSLPVPLMLDHNAPQDEREKGVCGYDWSDVPYLSVEAGQIGRRRIRRNVMRRSQQ